MRSDMFYAIPFGATLCGAVDSVTHKPRNMYHETSHHIKQGPVATGPKDTAKLEARPKIVLAGQTKDHACRQDQRPCLQDSNP